MMEFVQPSRALLAEVLSASGPHAATLCAGWDTRHLLAHLYLREHSPLTAAGIVVPPLFARTERKIEDLADQVSTVAEYNALVEHFAAGPPALSPMHLHRVDEAANLMEYFIHTEDVRRGNGQWVPRALDTTYENVLWEQLVRRAALMYRKAPVGIILVRPHGEHHVVKKAPKNRGSEGRSVVITGAPGELALHAYGRTEVALVTQIGDPETIAALNG